MDADDYEYCFVCSRSTDHRSEHDDWVQKGLAVYDRESPIVRLTRNGVTYKAYLRAHNR